jgi:hypothetical protein
VRILRFTLGIEVLGRVKVPTLSHKSRQEWGTLSGLTTEDTERL